MSRRRFMQSAGATGAVMGWSGFPCALLPEEVRRTASEAGKKISLLEDGGFTGSAWGWQFTPGATVVKIGGHGEEDAIHVKTESGDYVQRLRELCGVSFVSERYAGLAYGGSSIPTRAEGMWPNYDAAPSMLMKAEGARVLLADVDGHPVVTEFGYGTGRVVFSADPVELHGDPQL